MSTPSFQAGTIAKVFLGTTELPSWKWTTKDMANTQDASNTRDGRWRIAGLNDSEGSFSVRVDSNGLPTDNPPNITRGTILTVKNYVTPTRFVTATIIVEDVTYSSEVTGQVDFEGGWKLQSGTLTYP